MKAYEAGLSSERIQPGAARTRTGTMNALIVSYYASARFTSLATSTQRKYRNIIEQFRVEHGDKSIAGLRREHIATLIDAKAATPWGANNLLKALRAMLAHAVDMGMRDDNPAQIVNRLRSKSEGYRTWDEADIARFEAYWPVGTRQRLAFDLLLYTGQRRGDVIRIGPQHIREGVLTIRQSKTGQEVVIPVHPVLKRSIDAFSGRDLAFLVTEKGQPFSAAGFGNWMRDAIIASGLGGLSSHGLRKAMCRRLAEAGCTAHEIMAISGHTSLSEAQRYTRAANRAAMGISAFRKMDISRTKILKPGGSV